MDALGKTTVSEDVFQSMAEIALKDIEDIVTQEKKGPFAGLSRIFAERFSPQVTVKRDEKAEGE
ncbi:MAG: Asp23/Gls24 family envelope stress response protein, partial [Firmicutes bacterium]|nr:Asp23/Gls24 family envelope stress response protein [Bacillota bacterium]